MTISNLLDKLLNEDIYTIVDKIGSEIFETILKPFYKSEEKLTHKEITNLFSISNSKKYRFFIYVEKIEQRPAGKVKTFLKERSIGIHVYSTTLMEATRILSHELVHAIEIKNKGIEAVRAEYRDTYSNPKTFKRTEKEWKCQA